MLSDNNASMIQCSNGRQFYAGDNSIYSSNGLLNSNNDKKAKTLCLPRYTFHETYYLPSGRQLEIRVPEEKAPRLEVPRIIEMLQQGKDSGEGFEVLPVGQFPIRICLTRSRS